MNNLSDLEGQDDVGDAFDWLARDALDRAEAEGITLSRISMGEDSHEGAQTHIATDNVDNDTEKGPLREERSQAKTESVQTGHARADAHGPGEDESSDADDQNLSSKESSEVVAGDVEIAHRAADLDDAMHGAFRHLPQQGDSGHQLDATSESSTVPGDMTVDEVSMPGNLHLDGNDTLAGSAGRQDSQESSDSCAEFPAHPIRFEIPLPTLPESLLEEYSTVFSEVVDRIRGQVEDADAYHAEFTDGRIETITHDQLLELSNGQAALDEFFDRANMDGNPRKRKHGDGNWDSDFDESEPEEPLSDAMDVDGDETDQSVKQFARRSSRRVPQKPRIIITRGQERGSKVDRPPRSARSLRPRGDIPSYYGPEPGREDPPSQDGVSDDDFRPVISDIAPVGRGKHLGRRRAKKPMPIRSRSSAGGSDIEFEPLRRSSRATKNMQGMNDEFDSDEDFESIVVVKERGAPKIVTVKEIFQPIDPKSPFAIAHMQKCHVCSGSQQKGQLLYCQGCSLTFHRGCIGLRSSREHIATKVGEDSFVLQCKYCIGVYTSRESIAAKYDMCQQCKSPGLSCSAFAPKRTGRQEEKLREENNGVDPVAPVARELINNSENVLFRCQTCHRGWHQNHLPQLAIQSDIGNHPKNWRCSECTGTTHKIHRLVAWRPTTSFQPVKGQRPPYWQDVSEDDKEYLVKWETKSYAHCTWLPGAWVFGIAAALSRKAFGKRDLEQSLLKMTEKDAIPDDFLAPDIILVAKMDSTAPPHRSKEEMMSNISHVCRIFVKFQGLGYEDVVWDTPPAPHMTTLRTAFVEAYGEYVNGKYFEQESQAKIRHRVEEFKAEEFTKLSAQPDGIRRGKLMAYQLEGLNWLLENYHQGRSVVLADEMGLGKTVQVVSLVTSLVQDSPKCWPFLIVVPNSTCPNWRREFRQWAPDVRVVAYHGGRESQDLTYRYELFPEQGGSMRAHVVIMSYDSAQDAKTPSLFKSVKWAGLVVDEGQRLKNDQNLLYQALRAMRIPFQLLLTGTPLQNNKRELFNLVQFIDRTQDAAKLDAEFEVLDKETLPQLHDRIRPYFLRRTKAGVLKFLPPMAQIIVPVTMTVVQEKLAKSIMAKNPELIKAIFAEGKLGKTERGSLNNILMQLRKCLCHPFMYSENIEERHHDHAVMFRNLIEASAKLVLLEIMLPKLKERGHRVLIFSQFLQQLDIIEDFLVGLGYEYRRLDGAMSSLEKQKRIDAFNEPDSPLFAFLLSTRAGGVGINLATADTVIIMDPDFNPHQDLQALSRAHRIGQKNKVLCFQLMTKDSVEERIVQVGRSKMALDHALIESMDDNELEGADLESILKHGASALFNENYQKTKIEYTSAMVDSLLDRSQIEQANVEEKSSGENPFSHTRVWDSGSAAFASLPTSEAEAPLPLNSGVWDKIIAQREEEARRKAEANREVLGRGGRRRTKIDYTAKAGAGAPTEDAENGASSESDEFSGDDSSTGSDDDEAAVAKEEDETSHRELRQQTNTTQTLRPAEAEPGRVQGAAIPSGSKWGIKEKYALGRPAVRTLQHGKIPGSTNAAYGQAVHRTGGAGHASSVIQVPTNRARARAQAQAQAQAQDAPVSAGLVAKEFWPFVARLASEVEVRVAIDKVAHDQEQGTVKQVRLYMLHERLREVSAAHRNRNGSVA